MDRECNKCIHHSGGSCSSFECNMQTLEEHDKEVRGKAIEEFAKKANDRIAEFILNHQEQLTFVSGVSYGWRIIDEVAEEMKGE